MALIAGALVTKRVAVRTKTAMSRGCHSNEIADPRGKLIGRSWSGYLNPLTTRFTLQARIATQRRLSARAAAMGPWPLRTNVHHPGVLSP